MSNPANRHYYWLNANKDIWSFDVIRVGQEEGFPSYDGKKHITQECYFEAQEGDLFIGYQTSPIKKILALGKISYVDQYTRDGENVCCIYVEKYISLEHPVSINELIEAGLDDIPVVNRHRGTIFPLKKDEFRRIIDVIYRHNPDIYGPIPQRQDYTFFDFLEELTPSQAFSLEIRKACYIEFKKYANTEFTSEEVKNQLGRSGLSAIRRSELYQSTFLFDDKESNLQWLSLDLFQFSLTVAEDLYLDLEIDTQSYPVMWEEAQPILNQLQLDLWVHMLRDTGNNSYRYAGIAELSLVDTDTSDPDNYKVIIQGALYNPIPVTSSDTDSTIVDDISRIEEGFESIKGGEEKEALVKQRLHHIAYRKNLISKYGDCCLCHIKDEHLLTASHIKPWTECDSGEEKTDPNNGLLLCPNHDRLFDRGYISFDENGRIMISDALNKDDQIKMNVRPDMTIVMTPEINNYMAYHRENKYKDA